MKILVTGGSGFLGSHIVDALTDSGYEVVIFDQQPSPYLRENQEMVIGDISNLDEVCAAAQGCTRMYHLAAVADLDAAKNTPVDTVRVNILGTANALEAARQSNMDRFLFASTVYVYSNHGSFYRTTKRACELLIEDYWERYSLPFTILRYGSLFGPRADSNNWVNQMLTQALNEGKISYPGTGNEVREYIHVHDAAVASVQVQDPSFENENISVMGHVRMTTREMMEMVKEILGNDIDIECAGTSYEGHYVLTPYNFTPKMGKKLIRETYVDLGSGLLECLQEIHSNNSDEKSQ